jgi:hypothetical protein
MSKMCISFSLTLPVLHKQTDAFAEARNQSTKQCDLPNVAKDIGFGRQ